MVAFSVALTLAAATGAVALSTFHSGHAVTAMKAVTQDNTATTTSKTWVDVPNMSLTLQVPSGQQAQFLVTFSSVVSPGGNGLCYVHILVNRVVMAPGMVRFAQDYSGWTTGSMQFVAGPEPAGSYTFTVQFMVAGINTCSLWTRTLSVLRSRV
jgi:hypothetical protein